MFGEEEDLGLHRAILLQVIGDEQAAQSMDPPFTRREELGDRFADIAPEKMCSALEELNEIGVINVIDDLISPARSVHHVNRLGLVGA